MKNQAQRILYIDDNPCDLMLIKYCFHKSGIEIITVNKYSDFLRVIGKNYFDIVITDIEMPEINGMELSEKLRTGTIFSINNNIKIIGLSSLLRKDIAQQCYNTGIDYLFQKPINKKLFVSFIKGLKNSSICKSLVM